MPRARRTAVADPEPTADTHSARKARARRDAIEGFQQLTADGPLDPETAVETFLAALDHGEPWYPALLRIVARWTAASEDVEGDERPYLIAGEAFDWLRLAERLLDAAGDRIPADEAERLLFRGEPPDDSDEDAFARAIGPAKHRAHLNFQYGVIVEETLLLSAELEMHKARNIDGVRGEPPDVVAYEHVYGKPLAELLVLYKGETGATFGDRVRQSEWHAFIYWCSKYRFRTGEPARVASDTRKALALLSKLHAEGHRPTVIPEETEFIESLAYATEDD